MLQLRLCDGVTPVDGAASVSLENPLAVPAMGR